MLFSPKEKGQGLVEYALILVLVAIVTIAALMILGPILAQYDSWIEAHIAWFVGAGIVMLSALSVPAFREERKGFDFVNLKPWVGNLIIFFMVASVLTLLALFVGYLIGQNPMQ
jgi:pilus assembly protein Flp/PilA